MGRQLKAVFFDVGNTLLFPYPSVASVVRDVLIDEGHCQGLESIDRYMPLVDEYYEDRYREDDTFWTNEDETSAVWVGMYSLLCRKLGIEVDAERIARRVYDEFGFAARWRAFEDVRPAFERLRSRGLKVGLISNWDTRLRGLFDGLELSSLVDTIVSSAEVGLHKPDPRIFELAMDRLGVDGDSAAHVGDHYYADIVGAEAVGMLPVLISRFEPPTVDASYITSLDQLDDVLDAV